jgi:hypothetical protein
VQGHVFVLGKPHGFDTPFLADLRRYAAAAHAFTIPPADTSSPEPYSVQWTVPTGTLCSAVRVQLEGVYTLTLQRAHVWQGNDATRAANRTEEAKVRESYRSRGHRTSASSLQPPSYSVCSAVGCPPGGLVRPVRGHDVAHAHPRGPARDDESHRQARPRHEDVGAVAEGAPHGPVYTPAPSCSYTPVQPI